MRYNSLALCTLLIIHNYRPFISVRETDITNISANSNSVFTNQGLKITCTVVGKPLINPTGVTWSHENKEDLANFVVTMKGIADDFTLESVLTMTKPPIKYSGDFSCSAGGKTRSVHVSISGKFFIVFYSLIFILK